MEKGLTISPYEIVGSPLCVASDDGQKVFERIAGALKGLPADRQGGSPSRSRSGTCRA
jgi:hypothetical protein